MFVCKWITVCLNSPSEMFLICTEVKKNKFPDVIPPPACRGQRTPLIWMKGSKRFPVKYLFEVQNKTVFSQSLTRKRRREDARQFVFKSALWAVFSFTSGESRRFSIHTNTFLLRLFTCDVFDTQTAGRDPRQTNITTIQLFFYCDSQTGRKTWKTTAVTTVTMILKGNWNKKSKQEVKGSDNADVCWCFLPVCCWSLKSDCVTLTSRSRGFFLYRESRDTSSRLQGTK